MSLRVQRIGDLEQLSESVQAQWNRLPMPSPMQSADWLIRWWKTFGEGEKDQLCVLLVFDGECLVAVAPWYLSRQWMQASCLRFLGDGITCSDHSTIVIQHGYASAVLTVLADWLQDEAGNSFHAIQFEAINEDDATVNQLVQDLRDFGCETHIRDAAGCWIVDLPRTWDEFLACLSKNHRKRCRRWQRKYFDSGRAEVIRSPVAAVGQVWDQLAILNQQRRKQMGDRSTFLNDRFHQFHLSVLPNLIVQEKAELRELRIDGRIVAIEYVLFHDGRVFCYQSGMETSSARDGPGNLSVLALFRDAIASGYTRLDFLRGDEDYKRHWGALCKRCVDHSVASNSLSGSAHVAYYRAVDWVRTIRDSLVETPQY